MIIVTCSTPGSLTPQTRESIDTNWVARGNHWHWHTLDPRDPGAYGHTLERYWDAGQDFCIVEPDIVIRADVADALTHCDCDYGCFPYPWLTQIGPALGCTWFRAPLIKRHPGAMREAAHYGWRQLDIVLMRHQLARQGEQPHVHLPPVEHLNPTKYLRPGADPTPTLHVPSS